MYNDILIKNLSTIFNAAIIKNKKTKKVLVVNVCKIYWHVYRFKYINLNWIFWSCWWKAKKKYYVLFTVVLKLTLDILGLLMKSKKKRSQVFFMVGFWVILVQDGHSFFNFYKGSHLKKSLGNPDLYTTHI